MGQFVFPKKILYEKGVLAGEGSKGKERLGSTLVGIFLQVDKLGILRHGNWIIFSN